jgi:L-alanine-DL-glutamate epimerase-like enolase superfamily enzyme
VSARKQPRPATATAHRIAAIEVSQHRLHLQPPFHASWDTRPRLHFDATIVRVRTDSGLVGLGSGDLMVGFAGHEHLFVGQDALALERHYRVLANIDFHYGRCWPLDLALWDLAGKITGLPVCNLLGGPFRDAIKMYSHGVGLNMLDPVSCRDFAKRIKTMPEGFTAFKCDIHPAFGGQMGRYVDTLDSSQLRSVAKAYANVREAVGDEIDIAVHCHNELDLPSAVGVAKAVEPIKPLFMEDPMNPSYSEAWAELRKSTRLTLMTGEKLELVRGFRPFLDTAAVDIVHPDLAFAGGFTGVKKIADYAALTRTPVALHNVGSLVLTYANAHFGSSIQNFYRSESALGRPNHYIEGMSAGAAPDVRNGLLKVPTGPGLGLDINPDFLRKNLVEGEEFWG